MDTSNLMKLGIAAGILYAAYHFGNDKVKGGAISIAAVIAAKQIPYVKDYV